MAASESCRDKTLDCIKGFLIVLVVCAHYKSTDIFHDVCFLFHMPLFFVISGYLLNESKLKSNTYLKGKIYSLVIPYCFYLALGFIKTIRNQSFSIGLLVDFIWGGRAINGVYWYVTCYAVALCTFAFLIRNFKTSAVKILIGAGGGIAVIESNFLMRIEFLINPGIPWNLDVVLLVLVYIAIGFYGKDNILLILHSDKKVYDFIAAILAVSIIVFCVLNYGRGAENEFYYFDMKPVYYKELISAVLIPCCFGYVIIRVFRLIDRFKIFNFIFALFSFLGKMTFPIMFMHLLINSYSLNRLGFVVAGIGVPCISTIMLGRFSVARVILGLPKVSYAKKDGKDCNKAFWH